MKHLLLALALGLTSPPSAGFAASRSVDSAGDRAIFNAAQDGAKCDGTTDDATAINTTLARIRAVPTVTGTAWPIGHFGTLVLPQGRCLIKSTLNATRLYGAGFVWDGSGTQIVCQTSGTPCVDGSGTGQATWRDLNILGSAINPPNIGLMLSRLTTSLSVGADHNKVENPTIVGNFTLAAYYARSTETTIVSGAFFDNYSTNAYAAIWDGSNAFHIQSALSDTTYTNDTFSSNNENTCLDCIFEVFGSGDVPIWIGGTTRHKFYNSYALSRGGGSKPAVVLSFVNRVNNDFLQLDLHVENSTLANMILVTGAANPVINGLTIEDPMPFQSGPLFARDRGVSTVSLRGVDLKIGALSGDGPSWWDSAAAWSVSGRIFNSDGTYTAPGSFSGNYCIKASCKVTDPVGTLIDEPGVREALTTSGYTVPAGASLVRFTQTRMVTSATIRLPTMLADGWPVQFVNYAGAVTALNFSPVVNGWKNGSTLAVNTGLRVRWDATAAAWYREE